MMPRQIIRSKCCNARVVLRSTAVDVITVCDRCNQVVDPKTGAPVLACNIKGHEREYMNALIRARVFDRTGGKSGDS
ncbi:MAG: hypothetical protein ACM3KM_03640 [Acidobacteriaceae bacterium]